MSIDDVPLGQTAPKTSFYKEVAPGEHKLATESEFGEQTLVLNSEAGKNYFVKQSGELGSYISHPPIAKAYVKAYDMTSGGIL